MCKENSGKEYNMKDILNLGFIYVSILFVFNFVVFCLLNKKKKLNVIHFQDCAVCCSYIVFLYVLCIMIIIWSPLMPVLFRSFFFSFVLYNILSLVLRNAAHYVRALRSANRSQDFYLLFIICLLKDIFLKKFYFICHQFHSIFVVLHTIFHHRTVTSMCFLVFSFLVIPLLCVCVCGAFLILIVHFAFCVQHAPMALDIFWWECARPITFSIFHSVYNICSACRTHASKDRRKICSFFVLLFPFISPIVLLLLLPLLPLCCSCWLLAGSL